MTSQTAGAAGPTLDFGHVSREIRSLVSRRRELMTFLGSLFAALGIYLDNLLQGKFPPILEGLGEQTFATYSIMVLLPTVIIALRIARLHGGMVINGVFYQYLIRPVRPGEANPQAAARINWSGVSNGLFVMCALIAGLAAALLILALHWGLWWALAGGTSLVAVLLGYLILHHRQQARFALAHGSAAELEPVDPEEIEDHMARSLEDANHDMIGVIGFVGLILFSVLQNLSGLGGLADYSGDIDAADVLAVGPWIYALLAVTAALVGALIYLRLSIAIGKLSIALDPTDRPYKVFKITDSFLGYLLLVALFGISVHLLTAVIWSDSPLKWWVDVACLIIVTSLYPLRIWLAKRAQ